MVSHPSSVRYIILCLSLTKVSHLVHFIVSTKDLNFIFINRCESNLNLQSLSSSLARKYSSSASTMLSYLTVIQPVTRRCAHAIIRSMVCLLCAGCELPSKKNPTATAAAPKTTAAAAAAAKRTASASTTSTTTERMSSASTSDHHPTTTTTRSRNCSSNRNWDDDPKTHQQAYMVAAAMYEHVQQPFALSSTVDADQSIGRRRRHKA